MTGKKRFFLFGFLTACFFLLSTLKFVYAFNETHLDPTKVPDRCSACHKGHGKRATVMLDQSKDELCFKCHGPVKKGIRGEAKTDIYTVILKRSNHPVINSAQYHVPGESLPERQPSTPRHVSCYDCHNPHKTIKDKTFQGVRGYSGRGARINDTQKEYEICYLCHSDSANLPAGSSNIAAQFELLNASFHPIEAIGRNRNVPSLKGTLSTNSTIDCSDCHGNDDRFGPKGPHGSNYEHILKANYRMDSGIESPSAYELCYECHNRNSILNDESFKAHKRHVLYANASCYACHTPHGSGNYENLINFDTRIVLPNSIGQLGYMKIMSGKPHCYLKCHINGLDYDHKMTGMNYCINTLCPPGW